MEVKELDKQPFPKDTIAAIGFFDGVHLGHRTLLEETLRIARAEGGFAAVITFDKHPRAILTGEAYFYMTPLEKRLEIFASMGFAKTYVIHFDKKKASLSPEEFLETRLSGLKTLVCGFDFTFGKNARGTAATLTENAPFPVVVCEAFRLEGKKVASTNIRELIASGRVRAAAALLGRHYSVKGEVASGAKKGRTIRYPTANLSTGEYLLPRRGVYVTRTFVKGEWRPSVSVVGKSPTLNYHEDLRLETHILDFQESLYGETLEVAFLERIRDEKTFATPAELKARVDADVARARRILDVEG